MRPPPIPSPIRPVASHSDSLLSLLALATTICRLAARIQSIDAQPPPDSANTFRALPLRRLVGPAGRSHRSRIPVSGVESAVTLRSGRPGVATVRPRRAASHLQLATAKAPSLRSRSTWAPSQSQDNPAETVLSDENRPSSAAPPDRDPIDPSPPEPPSGSTSPQGLLPASTADAHTDSPASSHGSRPAHWQADWLPKHSSEPDEAIVGLVDLNRRFEQILKDEPKRFAELQEQENLNGFEARRILGHRLWQVYQNHAHKQALPLHVRIGVAKSLARAVHLVTTNHVTLFKKAFRYLFSRRIRAIYQDCQVFLERTGNPPLSSPRKSQLRFSIRMLEPTYLALDAKPLAALKAMDTVLRECRPDIYQMKDLRKKHVHLSTVDRALIAILDSLVFEVRCPSDAAQIAARIRSQASFFDDTTMLQDVLDGQIDATESQQPIEDALKWYATSPHAFLFSHPAFRHARSSLLFCLSHHRDAAGLVERLGDEFDASDPAFASTCEIVLRAALIYKGSTAALELYDELWSMGVPLHPTLLSRIIREAHGQDPSARLEALLNRSTANGQKVPARLLRTVAEGWALRNRMDRVAPILAKLRRGKSKKHEAFEHRLYMQLFAARGDIKGLVARLAILHDFQALETRDCQAGKRPLGAKEFGLLLKACNRNNDAESAEHFLAEAVDRGIKLRASDYNSLIDTYARRSDIDTALSIFEQMRDVGIQPDKYTYTILIQGFALRRDPDAAAHTLRAMVAAGHTPDRITYAALLNCYVESGVYGAAIRLFGWMQRRRDARIRPSIEVCNMILKAYVLSALPVQKVMRFVSSVRRAGLQPNAQTYALMLQSACDAGLMHIAEDVFSEAENVLPNPREGGVGQGANLFHFTIMIHGYLRLGDQTEAKEYFDEMQRRKLRPSAITWSVMVHSYARSDNDVNYNLASTLVSQLVSDEDSKAFKPSSMAELQTQVGVDDSYKAGDVDAPLARKGPSFAVLHTVLMAAQARRGEPEMVERTMERLASSTTGLTVLQMTPLLDAYRRVDDVESALLLFEQIYKVALETASIGRDRVYAHSPPGSQPSAPGSGGEGEAEGVTIRRLDANSRALLCMPISLMIDVLSTAGRHEEIARIWTRAKQDGFGFDASNWNHLAASMARAGQLEEALSVVERVLYHEPPRSWMHERAAADLKARSAKVAAEAESSKDWKSDEDEANDGHKSAADDGDEFDLRVAEDELDPAAKHRSDAASVPSRPPNRRYESRSDDDPYTELPLERRGTVDDDVVSEIGGSSEAGEDCAEPSAFYLDANSGLPDVRELVGSDMARLSPWYAHFDTMEAISRGLAETGEASSVVALLDRFPTAASLIDRHERKVEIMRERQREEAVRSARDLIDGRS
ncbi:FOG: PPR repeat [Moesziomyces antarcticus T-34]|uniref:FOG: PPR repeat n=1 Tax=Pseudozyma antarctica (strain T-34) TaxID=1151754 RepID=M9MBM0_PSEA3|nr:FOG: PPR repeat [Moesziomyces antarcticus T-34]